MAASTPGTGGSQLLHFVFVFLEFSVHHFESSEEVPEEEQQKRESQNKNLRGEGEKRVRAEGTTLATYKWARVQLGWQV